MSIYIYTKLLNVKYRQMEAKKWNIQFIMRGNQESWNFKAAERPENNCSSSGTSNWWKPQSP